MLIFLIVLSLGNISHHFEFKDFYPCYLIRFFNRESDIYKSETLISRKLFECIGLLSSAWGPDTITSASQEIRLTIVYMKSSEHECLPVCASFIGLAPDEYSQAMHGVSCSVGAIVSGTDHS